LLKLQRVTTTLVPQPGNGDHEFCRSGRHACSSDGHGWRRAAHGAAPAPPVEGLGKPKGGEHGDNYCHRMMVNLAVAGRWPVIQIAAMRKKQDYVLSGRQ
jgi:hypothetical protein